MMAAILNSAILDSDPLVSSLRFTQKHSHSTLIMTQTNFNLTQTHSFSLNSMMAAILNSVIFKYVILVFSSQTDSHLSRLVPTICTKKFSLIHSHSTWHWQPSWIQPPWICHLPVFHSQNWLSLPDWFSLTWLMAIWFTHSFSLIFMMAAILNSAILDSNTLLSSLRFTQKHSHSTLTLTQTNSIWLKLIHSHLTWWWQPSWILPS